MTPKRHVAFVAGLACLLHVPSFWRPFMDNDELSYAGIACRLLHGGGRIYHDGVENKFPAIYYIYKSVFAVFGRYNMLAIHVAVTLVAIATALVVGDIARRFAGERAGRWAAVLYVVFSACYYPKMLAGNTEMFAVLPSALAVWCYLRARDGRWAWFVAAGACAALALLCKQVVLATFAALLADRALTALREGTIARGLRDLALIAAGFAAVIAAMVLHLRAIGVLDEAVFWTWTYVLHYYMPSGGVEHGYAFNLATCFVPFLLAMGPLVYLAWRGRDRSLSVVYWWLAGNICASWVGGRMYGHYMLLFVPALAALAGVGAARWLTDARARERRWIVVLSALLAGAVWVAGFLVDPAKGTFVRPDPDYRQAAAYVQAHTTTDDEIFVWGWFPALYQASDRCPSTRFVYTHILSGRGQGGQARFHDVPEAWDMLMTDLEAAPPAFVLDTSAGDYNYDFPPEKYPRLWQFLQQRYVVDRTIEGVRIFARKR